MKNSSILLLTLVCAPAFAMQPEGEKTASRRSSLSGLAQQPPRLSVQVDPEETATAASMVQNGAGAAQQPDAQEVRPGHHKHNCFLGASCIKSGAWSPDVSPRAQQRAVPAAQQQAAPEPQATGSLAGYFSSMLGFGRRSQQPAPAVSRASSSLVTGLSAVMQPCDDPNCPVHGSGTSVAVVGQTADGSLVLAFLGSTMRVNRSQAPTSAASGASQASSGPQSGSFATAASSSVGSANLAQAQRAAQSSGSSTPTSQVDADEAV